MSMRRQRRSKTYSFSIVEELQDDREVEEEPDESLDVETGPLAIPRRSGRLAKAAIPWLVRAFIALAIAHLGGVAAHIRRHGN
jgi:hypothetical protein